MAYFSNGSSGACFEEQCDECRYGKKPCPIALIQLTYNYDAVNNNTATKIMSDLIKNDGTCEMFKSFKKDFQLSEGEKSQQELDLFH